MTDDQLTLQRHELSAPQRALLAQRLQGAHQAVVHRSPPAPGIRPRAPREHLPLSFAQERLWFLEQLHPGQAVYNVYQALRLQGPLDQTALERSLNELVARHEAFRTNFTTRDDGPVQVVAPARTLRLTVADLADSAGAAREAALQRLLRAEAARPFDLAGELLLRALLVRLGEAEHVLLLTMHHIISDGWSLGIVFRELTAHYAAFLRGAPAALPELPVQYADYAIWERECLPAADLEKSLAYWRGQIAGVSPLDLPTDHPRPAVPTTGGATQFLSLSAPLTTALKGLGQREGVTLFMTLLAAFQALLHRYTGQTDITIGSCMAGRPQLELEKLVGFFVNTLVFRGDFSGDPTFREFLARTRETALAAFAHQDLPFEKLVEELQPDRRPGRHPFFSVMFVLQSATGALPPVPGLDLQPLDLDNGTAKFDLTLSVTDSPQGLQAALEYSTDLFEAATITRLLGHFHTLLQEVAADPARRVSALPMLAATELAQILKDWSGVRTDYPRDATIGALFEAQVARAPDAIAVSHAGRQLTYRQLNERANQIARYVRRVGAVPGSLVGVSLERSADLIAALLGIVKAGCAYVSLDPTYPRERLAFMLQDTRAPVVVTVEKRRPALAACLGATPAGAPHPSPYLVCLDTPEGGAAGESTADLTATATAESTAYISYTSGSTGRPKGVCVPHRGVVRLVRGADYARFGPDEVFLQFAPVAFDASTLEIWGPLLNGGRLAVFPPLATLSELGSFIREQGVTTVWLTAGLFHQLVDHQLENLRGVRQLLAGGDVLSPAHVARALAALPGTRLINGYGPTENTTFTCCHSIDAPPPAGGSVPIGRPIANTEVFILDAARQPVPVGVPGELYTGGDGLAREYLNQPELTRERFVPHPFSACPQARLYRTGDRVRWRPDGTIEFLGRLDRQVKIRGFRVELEEIETTLGQHPAVREAVVVALPAGAGEKRLVAYAVAPGATGPELREYLQRQLPEPLLPAQFVLLPALPLTANGKVNRAALPAPETGPASAAFSPPRNETETQLAAIWERVLGLRPVGIHDNFFELGGHSLAGVRLFAQIEARFGRRLPLASLFQAPTVAELARRLEPGAVADTSSLVTLQPRGTRPPVFFVHGAGGGNLWTYTNLVPHLGSDQPVYALESRGMRGAPEFARLEDMAAHYVREIRAVQPRGPYYLGGYCFGGNVAYEMARQLHAQGEAIALLALLDSAPADGFYRSIPWWRPVFLIRFAVNTAFWMHDFLGQPPAERRRFVRRKSRTLWRRLARRFRRLAPAGPGQDIDLDDVIDVALFPEIEIQLWKVHLRALWSYRTGPYPGRVTLFRTRGQPFLCSFDPQFGWGGLAAGGVEVINVPGAHEKIFMEPHVHLLSARLRHCLQEAQARAARSASSPP